MQTKKVKFSIRNDLGLLLLILDKIKRHFSFVSQFFPRILRIVDEANYHLNSNPRLLRGYFQKHTYVNENKDALHERLKSILQTKQVISNLSKEITYLNGKYQVIHVRLGDYKDSNFGIAEINSQLSCIDPDINIVICTDGSEAEIKSRIGNLKAQIVGSNQTSGIETLALMAGAERIITTNSTLSWWGRFMVAGSKRATYFPETWSQSVGGQKIIPWPTARAYKNRFETV